MSDTHYTFFHSKFVVERNIKNFLIVNFYFQTRRLPYLASVIQTKNSKCSKILDINFMLFI